jgi:hypothetical protein
MFPIATRLRDHITIATEVVKAAKTANTSTSRPGKS